MKTQKTKISLCLFLLTLGIIFPTVAQRANYTFTFKVYINEATAQYYGGHAAIEDSITSQFGKVSQFYTNETNFTHTYTFVPSTFAYYSETGTGNQNVMDSLALAPPEPSYDYRVIYSRSPYGSSNSNIYADYTVDSRSVRFALNAESEWGEWLFGPTPTKILCHELGHSRGAYDLYAGNVDGQNNGVFNGVGYEYQVPSIMNYLYISNPGWDPHSIYCVNTTGSTLHTSTTWGNLFWSLFPTNFYIRTRDHQGNPVANAQITLYGVRWLSTSINPADAFVYYTDAQGLVTFDGSSTNNPFVRTNNNVVSDFANFMVVANVGTQGYYNWMNVFDVQQSKLDNETYYLDYTFNILPTVSLTSPSNNANYTSLASVTLTASASDTDGSISKVEFYNGTTLLSTQTTSPYTYNWTNVSAGSYDLTAVAYDDLNASTTSSAVHITVSDPSTCTAAAWNSTTAYTGGAVVQYADVKYIANWWSYNERPDLHNGGPGSGEPWTSQGTCNSRWAAQDESNSSTLSVSPNPIEEIAALQISMGNSEEVIISVYDQLGTKVSELYNGMMEKGSQQLDINLSNYHSGIYLITIQGAQFNQSVRVVKK